MSEFKAVLLFVPGKSGVKALDAIFNALRSEAVNDMLYTIDVVGSVAPGASEAAMGRYDSLSAWYK